MGTGVSMVLAALLFLVACIAEPQPVEPTDTGAPPATSETVELEVGDCAVVAGPAREDTRPLPVTLPAEGYAPGPELAVRVLSSTAEHDAWLAETGVAIDLSTVDFATETVAVGSYLDYSGGCSVRTPTLEVLASDDDPHVLFTVSDPGGGCTADCGVVEQDVLAVAVPRLDGTVTACAAYHGFCD